MPELCSIPISVITTVSTALQGHSLLSALGGTLRAHLHEIERNKGTMTRWADTLKDLLSFFPHQTDEEGMSCEPRMEKKIFATASLTVCSRCFYGIPEPASRALPAAPQFPGSVRRASMRGLEWRFSEDAGSAFVAPPHTGPSGMSSPIVRADSHST